MAEDYQAPEAPVQQEGKKKSNTALIVIIIVVVALLLCCCLFVVVGPMLGISGLSLLGPQIGDTFSNIIEQMGTPAP
jgi:uncharacterized protein YqhQ